MTMPIPKGMIDFIVNKMHVMTPDVKVVRDIYRRLKSNVHPAIMPPKSWRKRCYRYALKTHRANRKLFQDYRF